MPIQVIVSQTGPLPISKTFTAPGDEPMYLEVNGSVWCQVPNQWIGILVSLDGDVIGEAMIYSNGPTTHRAVVPVHIQVQLSEGQHTLTLSAGNAAVSDGNDLFTAVLHY